MQGGGSGFRKTVLTTRANGVRAAMKNRHVSQPFPGAHGRVNSATKGQERDSYWQLKPTHRIFHVGRILLIILVKCVAAALDDPYAMPPVARLLNPAMLLFKRAIVVLVDWTAAGEERTQYLQ
jgi:hypothetical protein